MPSTSGKQSVGNRRSLFDIILLPVITFDLDSIDIGVMKHGDLREVLFPFTNTGDADLVIELVTACKCTEIEWPVLPIPAGGKGLIRAIFDSTTQKRGLLVKALDVISNTDPMLVEAKFSVLVE